MPRRRRRDRSVEIVDFLAIIEDGRPPRSRNSANGDEPPPRSERQEQPRREPSPRREDGGWDVLRDYPPPPDAVPAIIPLGGDAGWRPPPPLPPRPPPRPRMPFMNPLGMEYMPPGDYRDPAGRVMLRVPHPREWEHLDPQGQRYGRSIYFAPGDYRDPRGRMILRVPAPGPQGPMNVWI